MLCEPVDHCTNQSVYNTSEKVSIGLVFVSILFVSINLFQALGSWGRGKRESAHPQLLRAWKRLCKYTLQEYIDYMYFYLNLKAVFI